MFGVARWCRGNISESFFSKKWQGQSFAKTQKRNSIRFSLLMGSLKWLLLY